MKLEALLVEFLFHLDHFDHLEKWWSLVEDQGRDLVDRVLRE